MSKEIKMLLGIAAALAVGAAVVFALLDWFEKR